MENKRSFTLIELLVVIAILAGFMALLVPNFMLIRVKSRDVKRKGDLKSIQKALELYKQSQTLPVYPASLPTLAGTVKYIEAIPLDPLLRSYDYLPTNEVVAGSGNFSNYVLCACLENPNDPEQIPTPACVGAVACTGGKYYKLSDQ